MPKISFNTPFDSDYPKVKAVANTIDITGSELPPNTPLVVLLNGQNIKGVQTDKNGNIDFTVPIVDAAVLSKFTKVGGGGGWVDKATKWRIECGDFNIVVSL